MKNKFMRSVTAMVVAVTMLISSQGVVTSFADGGDHSDMSESSSVQMNEVDNNGTDQSTENGTGEDAAVKDVVEMINALPAAETITEETDLVSLKDQVNAARAAYNALSDDQKAAFNADVLGKLTALEVKISELESNDQETKPSDVVQAVVDAINALPAAETITEETDLVSLKDQVNAARVAYDALSDDQKAAFDAATLEKLTALEAKISELESGNQETESSEAVQNVIEKIDAAVEQIDYTTETISATDGTTVTKTHITMLKDLDPANNAELKALIDKEAAHEQDENQPALTDEEAAKLSDARKAFEDAKAKYLSEGFSNAQLAARQAYDALATEEEKAQVTNYSLLTAMEENIAYIMQAVNTLPEGEPVAMIGTEPYTSLDDAVEKAEEGSTITLLKDCELTKGFNKTLTFNGTGKITIPQQLKSNGEGWMCFGLGDPSRVLTFDGVEVEWLSDGSAPWLMLSLSGTLNVTNGANLTFKFDSKTTKTRNAIYMNEGAVLNVTNASTFQILGVGTEGTAGQGIQLDKTGKSTINVSAGSTFLIDGTNRGYVNSPVINVEDSTFTVQNCTSNASNGGNFTATNSKVTYQNNKGHGLSAGDVILKNTDFLSDNNGLYGVYVSGEFLVDKDSTMTVTNNSYDGDCAGVNLTAAVNDGRVEAGAVVTITGNKCSGFSSRGVCTFEEGSKLTITGNYNDKGSASYGGGIYNTKDTAHLTLPSDAVIYNNHAVTGGDDIYNTGEITFSRVGTDWTLDDCNHKITGWYDDSDNSRWEAHEKPYHINEFVKFERNGMTTVKGLLSLKAAHGVDPINPGDPGTTEWEHSKSKTATNLDKNYQSQVTLSLPSAEEQLVSDVVFVLDKSTSATVEKQMLDMLGSLKDQVTETGAKVKVGVIIFNKEAHSVLELTELNSDNMGKIQEAIGTTISSGTNTHAGLLAGKAMLDADTSVDANRKYMILVSDGMTYMFDEPAQAINSIQATNGENEVMAGTDCWGIRHYLEGKDSFIPEDWTSYLQDVGSKLTEIEQYIQPYDNMDKTNYISKGNTELPTTVDVALYKTQEVFKQMQNNGYHCYSVLAQTNITNYPWGPAFMNYLAGGKEVSFNDIQNDIYYLLDAGSQVVDVIGEGVDNAGNEYNFDFVDKIENIDVKVGGEIISKERIADPQFSDPYITTAYGFGDGSDNNHEEATQYPNYDFVVKYYANGRDGKSDECFVWEMNTAVSNFAPVQLTYTVQLTNPQTTDGTYGQYDEDGSEKYTSLYTNKEAILYPVDTNHNSGVAEYFQKPTVSYTISNGKPVDPPVDPEDPTPRPGGGGDEDDDTPTIINETPVPTTTIDDEDVPLTNLPEDTVTIDDEEVPLKDIPNTGDMIPVPAMVAAVISIGGIALLMKKHK
ncbi:doubled motif LPXTG anchor domain-containing protein [Negativibacillus massiliensis]|uniref:doubled motif LPXTG anchor domain-containing protein n=1 Tax=Negativibacillus massiliensis TaxID=1871035 RepID=UPI000978C200|nr:doubled motif LPXTG anchor domain-containing protein [Negativibacillus massiliensis]